MHKLLKSELFSSYYDMLVAIVIFGASLYCIPISYYREDYFWIICIFGSFWGSIQIQRSYKEIVAVYQKRNLNRYIWKD